MLDRQVVEDFLDGEFEEGDWEIPGVTLHEKQEAIWGDIDV